MYSLDCPYYKKRFFTLTELLDAIMQTGMDPNYEITRNGINTKEIAADLIVY